jgi:hypothetical protein
MKYKVTSKRDITILANVRTDTTGEGKTNSPETLMWIPVFANKPTDKLGEIVGIDPRCVHEPNANTVTIGHFTYVPINPTGDVYSKEHFGLFKIEPSSESD